MEFEGKLQKKNNILIKTELLHESHSKMTQGFKR